MQPPQTALDWFSLTLRILIGVLFLVAGVMKAFVDGPAVFSTAIANYQVIREPWTLMVAYFLPWLEMIVGGCLIGGFLVRGGLVLALGMTLVFAGGIAQAWARRLEIACGCFGESHVKSNYPAHLAGLALLAGSLAFVMVRDHRLRSEKV